MLKCLYYEFGLLSNSDRNHNIFLCNDTVYKVNFKFSSIFYIEEMLTINLLRCGHEFSNVKANYQSVLT